MCHHLSLKEKAERLAERYRLKQLDKTKNDQVVYHNNAFDFLPWPVITSEKPDTLQMMHWGFIPAWRGDREEALKLRKNTVNARIEDLFDRPTFKDAAQKRHCLIPATGFFEWQAVGGKKYPYYIHLKNERIFSMAGIWDRWTDRQSGETKETFSILTTSANPLMASIHNLQQRMPVILTEESEHDWLQNGFDSISITAFAKPFDEQKMAAYTIGRLISGGNSDTPEVLKPYTYPEFNQISLF